MAHPQSLVAAGRAPSPRTGAKRLPPNPLSGLRPQPETDFSGGWGRLSGPASPTPLSAACLPPGAVSVRPPSECSFPSRAPPAVISCKSYGAGGRGWAGGCSRCVRARPGAPAGVGAGPCRALRQNVNRPFGPVPRWRRAARLRRRSGPVPPLLRRSAPACPSSAPAAALPSVLLPASWPLGRLRRGSRGYRRPRAAPTAAAEGATHSPIMAAGSRLSRVEMNSKLPLTGYRLFLAICFSRLKASMGLSGWL